MFLLLQKNAMLGGAITGFLISAASNNGKDKIIKDTITAGAVATAIEFIKHLTWTLSSYNVIYTIEDVYWFLHLACCLFGDCRAFTFSTILEELI